ncbi:M24 family metallopeptidase [Microbacterium sp. NPDC007973]|uniref:M24 family metallopeptidase n=1 Tax=Microbacterium sp. NPDC007973 TaxID=3364182 RepID=UPI0036E2DA5C
MPTFPATEYADRLQRFQRILVELDLDVAVVTAPENICYLVGHETPGYYTYQCLLVPRDGQPTILLRETETVNAEQTTYLSDIRGYADVDDPIARTIEVVRDVAPAPRRVGLEERSWFLPPVAYRALTEAFVPAQVVAIDDEVASLRLIKSPAEIEVIRAAAAITDAGVRAAALTVAVGVPEREVAAAGFAAMIRAGSEYVAMEPFVASGPRAGNIHAWWGDRRIEAGEGVLLEMSATKGRYNAPLMHTVRTGALSGESARMAEACLAARDATLAVVRPGRTPAEAHARCKAVVAEHGLSHTYRKRSGYSVGIGFAPDWGEGHILSLKETEHRPFEPGMVVHVVPTLRAAGVAGQGFSATVLITPEGNEILTSCDVFEN